MSMIFSGPFDFSKSYKEDWKTVTEVLFEHEEINKKKLKKEQWK